jgi:hypothetical protein
MNVDPRIQATAVRLPVKIETRRSFEALRNEAARLLDQAYGVALHGGLSDTEIAQAAAASKIAGATFRPITLPADAQDFERLADDLRHVAGAVDGLIEAIGNDARINTTAASAKEFAEQFGGVVSNAIDGNALFLLEQAADAERSRS